VTVVVGAIACALVGWSTSLVRGELGDVVHWFLAGLAAVPTVTSLVSLVVLATPFQTVNLILTLVASAALIHVRRAAVTVAVLVVLGWLLAGIFVVPSVINDDTLSAMGMACAVAVILHLARQRTVARLDAAREQIATMAVTDELTGLGNRRALRERGEAVLAQARRAGLDVTLLYVDVDGLKQVNDAQGHLAGDGLLTTVGETLRMVFRQADVVARTGGDEFAVLLVGCAPEQTASLRARLADTLAAVGASASCGAVHLRPGDPDADLQQLVDRADLAMYREKNSRRAAAVADR
jgi:diguanylate cyclase (GGDEF)-like protein